MKTYKYAIKNNNHVKLCDDYDSIHCASETLIENPKYKISDNVLILSGDEVVYRFTFFYNDIKIEDVEDAYIITYKSLFGFGKEKKKIEKGWVRVKKRAKVKYTLSNFELYEEK
jgi:hypothetical protein